MNSLYKKGHGRVPMVWRINVNAMCYEDNYFPKRKFKLFYCCGATEEREQQHNQDLKEIYKGQRILEFITFYHNALHLTRVHCATNNSNKNTGK